MNVLHSAVAMLFTGGLFGVPGVLMTRPQAGKQLSSDASSPFERRARRSNKHQGTLF